MQDNYLDKHLICLLGRQGSGKTTLAKQLITEHNFVKISMADSMRELLWDILGYKPSNEDEYQIFKNLHSSMFPSMFQTWDNKQFNNVVQLATGRQLLQNIGESCKKMFGEDIWVNKWRDKVLKGMSFGSTFPMSQDIIRKGKVVCDDVRFPIEIEESNNLGATFIWCDYQNGVYPEDGHSSEQLTNKILQSNKYKHGDEIPFSELQTFFK